MCHTHECATHMHEPCTYHVYMHVPYTFTYMCHTYLYAYNMNINMHTPIHSDACIMHTHMHLACIHACTIYTHMHAPCTFKCIHHSHSSKNRGRNKRRKMWLPQTGILNHRISFFFLVFVPSWTLYFQPVKTDASKESVSRVHSVQVLCPGHWTAILSPQWAEWSCCSELRL